MNDFEQKSQERDARIQKAAEGPTSHKFSEQDKTPQGQNAIAQGIENKARGRGNYDYTKSAGADFSWPDFDLARIGQLEPWLCYTADLQGGWKDLNAIPSGALRRATAAYRMLGRVEHEAFQRVDETSSALIERLLSGNDSELAGYGLKKNDRYSCKDHLLGLKLEFQDAQRRGNATAQKMLDEANAIQKEEMESNIATAKSGGLLDPIQGVSMEDWAGANGKIAGGTALDDVLQVLGVSKSVWDAVSAEWMARMSQDTTFAITTVYGAAFTNSNIGKFASTGGAANAPGSGAAQKTMADFELYIKIMSHQNAAAGQGKDAATVLQSYGLSLGDWSALGAHWTTKMSTDFALAMEMGTLMQKFAAEFAQNGV